VVEFDDSVGFPEGTRVSIIAEESDEEEAAPTLTMAEWLERARAVRRQLPMTSDSTELLREIRLERSGQ